MKVLLVYPAPDIDKDYRFGYSLLLLYIASDLRDAGHEVSIVDYSSTKYIENEFLSLLSEIDVLVLEIDAFPLKRATNFTNAQTLALTAKKHSQHLRVIAVGKQCSLLEKPIDFTDLTISGDAELSLRRVLQTNELHGYYDAGCLEQLDLLPIPAYELLSHAQIVGHTTRREMNLLPSAVMETSRGCPGICTFCQRKGWSHGVQFFGEERVVEIFLQLAELGVRNIWVLDENFTGNLSRAKQILRRFSTINDRSRIRLAISSWVKIDEEFLELAWDAGVAIISFGIESITLQNQIFYKKMIDIERTKELIAYADQLGLYTVGNFIVGSPYDTEQTIEDNLQYALDTKFDVINVKTLDYMMGAELHSLLPGPLREQIDVQACRENGLSRFTKKEIKNIVASFQRRFRLSRIKSIQKKIQRFGTPYFEKEETLVKS